MSDLISPPPCAECHRETCEGTHIVTDVAADLARRLEYVWAIRKALPIDEEADRRVTAAINASRPVGYVSRKLGPRKP